MYDKTFHFYTFVCTTSLYKKYHRLPPRSGRKWRTMLIYCVTAALTSLDIHQLMLYGARMNYPGVDANRRPESWSTVYIAGKEVCYLASATSLGCRWPSFNLNGTLLRFANTRSAARINGFFFFSFRPCEYGRFLHPSVEIHLTTTPPMLMLRVLVQLILKPITR